MRRFRTVRPAPARRWLECSAPAVCMAPTSIHRYVPYTRRPKVRKVEFEHSVTVWK